jgi:anthranilate phosphoribosyltransferase
LKRHGAQNIMTVHSQDGLDELSTTAKNNVYFLHDGKIEKMIVDPEKLGLHKSSVKDLQVLTRQDAINAFLGVLNGRSNRSMQEITALNAAGGLIVANIAKDFNDGLEIATQTIKSGKAYSHFVDFIKETSDIQKLKEAQSP